jgi:hypothetical protein
VAGATKVQDDPRAKAILELVNGSRTPKGPYVVFKYVRGQLPPVFATDEQVSVGFQVDF